MLSRRLLIGIALLAALGLPSWAGSGGGHGGGGSHGGHSSGARSSGSKSVYVSGYTRKDGTYVQGHYRAAPGAGETMPAADGRDGKVEIVPHPTVAVIGGYSSARLSDGTTIAMRGLPAVRGRSVAFIDGQGRFVSLPLREVTWTDSGTRHRCATCTRDAEGRIVRSEAARREFERLHPCPATGARAGSCAGYVVDHVTPLACGGEDAPGNMQWQTVADGKAKDEWEQKACGR